MKDYSGLVATFLPWKSEQWSVETYGLFHNLGGVSLFERCSQPLWPKAQFHATCCGAFQLGEQKMSSCIYRRIVIFFWGHIKSLSNYWTITIFMKTEFVPSRVYSTCVNILKCSFPFSFFLFFFFLLLFYRESLLKAQAAKNRSRSERKVCKAISETFSH